MPIIEVPGHGQVEFPDDMSDDQIVAAIKKNALGYKKESPSNLERFTQGLKDPIDAGAQLLTNLLPESVVKAGNKLNNVIADKTGLVARLPEGGVNQQIQETDERFKTDWVDWYRLGGNVASPANLAIASSAPRAASLAGRVGQGIGMGGVMGALTPTIGDNFGEKKLEQIGLSAAVGGATPVVTGAIGRMISPKASVNPDIALLKKEGVTPTFGQTLGGSFNAAEEKMASIPVFGDAIAKSRGRALNEFNNATINRATSPIGEKVSGVGHDAVKEAGDKLSAVYDEAINKLKFVKFDNQFSNDLNQLQSMATGLEPKFERQFNKLIADKLGTRTSPNGSMLGDNYKKVISDLGDEVRKFEGMTNSAAVDYSNAVKQLQNLMRQQIGRGGNPEAANMIKAADKGWANLVRIEGAAGKAIKGDGVFTPYQLNAAAKSADSSVRDRSTARGTALLQDIGRAGEKVLGNKVPDSGTATRLMMGGGAIGASAMTDPMITAALLSGYPLYSRPVQQLLNASVTARPQLAQPVAKAVRNTSPYLVPLGTGLLNYQGQ